VFETKDDCDGDSGGCGCGCERLEEDIGDDGDSEDGDDDRGDDDVRDGEDADIRRLFRLEVRGIEGVGYLSDGEPSDCCDEITNKENKIIHSSTKMNLKEKVVFIRGLDSKFDFSVAFSRDSIL
jgi:hypothetical protein